MLGGGGVAALEEGVEDTEDKGGRGDWVPTLNTKSNGDGTREVERYSTSLNWFTPNLTLY